MSETWRAVNAVANMVVAVASIFVAFRSLRMMIRLNREFEARLRSEKNTNEDEKKGKLERHPRATVAQRFADWGDEKVDAMREYGARLAPDEKDELRRGGR